MTVASAVADAGSSVPLVRQQAPTQVVSQKEPASPVSSDDSTSKSAPTQQAYSVRSRFDENLNRAFFEVYDPQTSMVIVQFPPEKLVRYFRTMAARLGSLINQLA